MSADVETKKSIESLIKSGGIEGGPQKCGRLFVILATRAKTRDEHTRCGREVQNLPAGLLHQKEGTFFCDFMLMLDWVDESLSLLGW